MSGFINILNVGTGDTKLSFDPKKPAEKKRAAKVVEDMLKRGFAILVEVGKKGGKPVYQRAEKFDPKTCEYIIVGVPEWMNEEEIKAVKQTKGRSKTRTRVAAGKARAVAVARSAGG